MIKDHVNAVIPLAIGDYPAAHSMDTTWFAVDENGEIGMFQTGGCGLAPLLEGMEPPSTEEQERVYYTKAYDYATQYEAIRDYLGEQGYDEETRALDKYEYKYYKKQAGSSDYGHNRPPMPVHIYEPLDQSNCPYYWRASPKNVNVLTLEDLPVHLRSGHHLLFLKDYDFRSREPVDPFEYAVRCYNDWSGWGFYPDSPPGAFSQTLFPIREPGGAWGVDLFEEVREAELLFNGRGFFALDDEGFLALFRTDRFGATPLERLIVPPAKVRYDSDIGNDLEVWRQIMQDEALEQKDPALAEQREKAARLWRERGPVHWLDYPYGALSPRLFGIYLYDASWHHPLPYLRVGVPEAPLRFEQCAGELRGRIRPVRLPGIRFVEANRVQPFELIPCFSVSTDYGDEEHGWKHAQVWIDAALERIHPCHELSVFAGNTELLLRRARRHVRRIESLGRP